MSGRTHTPAVLAGAGTAVLLLVVAIGTGRVELAVTGALLLSALAMALPKGTGRADVDVVTTMQTAPSAGDGTTGMVATIEVTVTDGDLAVITLRMLEDRVVRRVVPTGKTMLTVRADVAHSGVCEIATVQAVPFDGGGLRWFDPKPSLRLVAHLEPKRRRLAALPVPAAPHRLTGGHDARRAGDGGAFRDIHPYAPGDRLRRIDWKATARLGRRPGDLYVRRTHATSDIDVAIVLDDGDDVTGELGDWARGSHRSRWRSSLDLGREAAWSFAAAYLEAGDSVSYQVLSRVGNAVPRGSGARHRERLRAVIVATGAQARISRARVPTVPPGALVVLVSTFLDDSPVRLATLWRAAGHRVLAVDVLPSPVTERMHREQVSASRIILGMRDDRLARVEAAGAETLRWGAGPGARAARLRVLARGRRRP